ncbi:hypothetical protein H5410_027824 [Solanum commersonii]|uniref:Integrase core domain containing protein n=1 Tax=Solanum commersonii TaxID=4109 RepID=A0A9J5Z4G8_SOLCO|nr:hypothetical protein H5410_027824 [Solanum commersonii]
MARDLGTYSEENVRQFYASYAATLRGSISKRSNPMDQDPLTFTVFRGCSVDISHATISHFLCGPTTGYRRQKLTTNSHGTERSWLQHWDSGVPIWHCDRLIHPTRTLDISLILDEANVAAPRREPEIEVPPLGADLADTVGQAQCGDPIIPDHSDTALASSSQASSMAPSSSRSTL